MSPSDVEIHRQRLKNDIFQVEHRIQQLHKEKVEQRESYKSRKQFKRISNSTFHVRIFMVEHELAVCKQHLEDFLNERGMD